MSNVTTALEKFAEEYTWRPREDFQCLVAKELKIPPHDWLTVLHHGTERDSLDPTL